MSFDEVIRQNAITLKAAEPLVRCIQGNNQAVIDAFWDFKRINDSQVAKLREMALLPDAEMTPEKTQEYLDFFNRTNREAHAAAGEFRDLFASVGPDDFYTGRGIAPLNEAFSNFVNGT